MRVEESGNIQWHILVLFSDEVIKGQRVAFWRHPAISLSVHQRRQTRETSKMTPWLQRGQVCWRTMNPLLFWAEQAWGRSCRFATTSQIENDTLHLNRRITRYDLLSMGSKIPRMEPLDPKPSRGFDHRERTIVPFPFKAHPVTGLVIYIAPQMCRILM
jgi:hypothetical protein